MGLYNERQRTAINTGGQFTHTIFIDARTLVSR